jgi:DNA-binding response OmpR family regulator
VNPRSRILLVEDDPSVAQLVSLYLRNAGLYVEHASTLAAARSALGTLRPHAVVLDLTLPDGDGRELFQELRARADTPVLALTARADDMTKVRGLEEGLDDYVTKPFNPRELVARVKAVLRRAGGGAATRPLTVGSLRVDPARREAFVGDRQVTLRAKEFDLLVAFCRQPGVVLTRERLLEDVWGFAFPGETRTVDVHVKQLRDKLADADAQIETVWGVGYKLVDAAAGTLADQNDSRGSAG